MGSIIQNTLYSPVFNSLNMSSNQTSGNISIQSITCYTVHAFWDSFAGDSGARFIVSGGNDGINFAVVDSIIPSGTSGSYMLNVEKAGYRFIKMDYTQSSAPIGHISFNVSGKII